MSDISRIAHAIVLCADDDILHPWLDEAVPHWLRQA